MYSSSMIQAEHMLKSEYTINNELWSTSKNQMISEYSINNEPWCTGKDRMKKKSTNTLQKEKFYFNENETHGKQQSR